MRSLVLILCLALIILPYLVVVSFGGRYTTINYPYPVFKSGEISGVVSGVFADYYATLKSVSFVDAYIYGCHINGTNGEIVFVGNITIDNSVISSVGNLTLIFEDSNTRIRNTFIYAKNLRIVLKNSTLNFLDNISYIYSRNIYFYIHETSNLYLGRIRFIGWNTVLVFNCTRSISLDLINWVSWGVVNYYSGSKLVLINSSVHIHSYFGSELNVVSSYSSISVRGIYDENKWLIVRLNTTSTNISITESKFHRLVISSMINSTLYLSDIIATGTLDIYSYLGSVELGNNITENGRNVVFIGNRESIVLEDYLDSVFYIYNVSQIDIKNTAANKITVCKAQYVRIINSDIRKLIIRIFNDVLINNSRLNSLIFSNGSTAEVHMTNADWFNARSISELSIISTNMSHAKVYSVDNLTFRYFSLLGTLEDTQYGKWLLVPGIRIALVRNLDFYDVLISNISNVEAEGYIYGAYSNEFIVQSTDVVRMEKSIVRMPHVMLGINQFYAVNTQFSYLTFSLLRNFGTIFVEKTTFNEEEVVCLENVQNANIIGKAVIAINASNISIEESDFVYAFRSYDLSLREVSNAFIYQSENISIVDSNITNGLIFSSFGVNMENIIFSWYFNIEDSSMIYLSNSLLNGSFLFIETSKIIELRNIKFYYSHNRYLPFVVSRLSILLFGVDNVVVDGLSFEKGDKYSIASIYVYNSRYVAIKNAVLGDSNIYIRVFASYMVDVEGIKSFGEYSGLAILYTNKIFLHDATRNNLDFVYIYGTQNFFIENIAVDDLEVLFSEQGILSRIYVNEKLLLNHTRNLVIMDTNIGGIGFLPYLTREEWLSIDMKSVTFRGMPLVVVFDAEDKNFSGSYGQLVLIQPKKVSVNSAVISSLFVANASDLSIENSELTNIVMSDSTLVRIRKNYVLGQTIIKKTANLEIINNVFYGAFLVSKSINVSIKSNSFYLKRWVYLSIVKSKNVVLMGNRIAFGIVNIDDCHNTSIIRNEFRNNFPVGLILRNNIMVFVSQNKFVSNGIGATLEGHFWWYYQLDDKDLPVIGAVWVENNRFMVFVGNDFRGNANVAIIDDSRRVYFIGNNFVANKHDFYVWDSDCHFSFSGLGNYWGNNNIVDNNNDGIDDEAYRFDYGEDRYPLANPVSLEIPLSNNEKEFLFYFTLINAIIVLVSYIITSLSSYATSRRLIMLISFIIYVFSTLGNILIYPLIPPWILITNISIIILILPALILKLIHNRNLENTLKAVLLSVYLLMALPIIFLIKENILGAILAVTPLVYLLISVQVVIVLVFLIQEKRIKNNPNSNIALLTYLGTTFFTLMVLPFISIVLNPYLHSLTLSLVIGNLLTKESTINNKSQKQSIIEKKTQL